MDDMSGGYGKETQHYHVPRQLNKLVVLVENEDGDK